MNRLMLTVAAAALVSGAAADAQAQSRNQIRIVGSSTVFPFTTAVAEQFSRKSGLAAPVVESTGTGGGFQLFCGGVGVTHPDFTNASRGITESEKKSCADNGVTAVTEMKVGYDGIVIANSKSGQPLSVTIPQLWQALAKEAVQNGQIVANPYTMWNEIDPSLPAQRIEMLGPPPTSGTRDAFVELVMEAGCEEFPEVAALEDSDEDRFETVCATMREDGVYVDAGENDNLIVQRLEANPNAYGIFGYSFLDQNLDRLQGSSVAGSNPTYEAIADGSYPVSRSLFVYVKNAHADVIPGVREFIAEYTAESTFGPDGYLADRGLIAMPEEERAEVRAKANALTPLSM